MPAIRETGAERKLREERQRAEEFAAEMVSWDRRLITLLLDYATLPNFHIRRDEGIIFFIPDVEVVGWNEEFRVPLSLGSFPASSMSNVVRERNQAEDAVKAYHAYVAEEARKDAVRKAAKAKLNDEEKLLLGIR